MYPVYFFGIFMLSCFIDLVNGVGCKSCAKGTNPLECLDAYTPSFTLDAHVCKNIRAEEGEVKRLCKVYGGHYYVKCELEDYSEISCVVSCVKSSPRRGSSGSTSRGHLVSSSMLSISLCLVLSMFVFFSKL